MNRKSMEHGAWSMEKRGGGTMHVPIINLKKICENPRPKYKRKVL